MSEYIKNKKQAVSTFIALGLILFISSVNSEMISAQQISTANKTKTLQTKTDIKLTFIELGSVRCIPCQKMQVVMKSIEKKYGKQINIIFYDVWTPEGKPFAQIYGISAIPTQVFVDEKGKEFFRHEGYFPEEELVKVLKTKGVK